MPLNVALIEPRIPPNTGNIARLCAAADTPLHLIGPLGFSLDEKEVKRAGLDYWDKTDLWVHENWFAFRDAVSRDRCLYFSANAAQDYRRAPFKANSVLIFGNETDGLPARILEKHPEQCYRIPMPGDVRSLNLANAVSVVLYEGLRKLDIALPEGAEEVDGNRLADGNRDVDGNREAAAPRKPARSRGRGRGKRS